MTTEAALPPRPLFLALAGANLVIYAVVLVEFVKALPGLMR